MNSRDIFQVSDRTQIARMESVLRTVMDGSDLLKIDYLVSQNWTAVPFESALHFDESDADRIATASAKNGCSECNAIPTEDLTHLHYYRVPMTREGLRAFNRECCHFNYLLVPDKELFIVFCSTGDYCIAAGSRDFVKTVLAKDIETARSDFRRFAATETLQPNRRYKEGIADRYQTVSGMK